MSVLPAGVGQQGDEVVKGVHVPHDVEVCGPQQVGQHDVVALVRCYLLLQRGVEAEEVGVQRIAPGKYKTGCLRTFVECFNRKSCCRFKINSISES